MNELINKKIEDINRLISLNMYNQAVIELYLTINLDLIRKVEIFTAYEINVDQHELKGLVNQFEKAYTDESILYSKLEKNLIEALKNHKIIDKHFFQKYTRLRIIRNYCAHPSIKEEGYYNSSYYEVMDMLEFFNKNLFSLNEFFCYKSEDLPNMLKNECSTYTNNIEKNLYCDHKYKIYGSANSFYLLKTLKMLLLHSISEELKEYHMTCCLNIRAISKILCERNLLQNFDYQILKGINHSDINQFKLSGFYELINCGIDCTMFERENSLLFNKLKESIYDKYYFSYIISIGEKLLNKSINELIYEENLISLNNLNVLTSKKINVDIERYITIMANNARNYDKNDELCETIISFETALNSNFIDELLEEKNSDSQFRDRGKYTYHINILKEKFKESLVLNNNV